MKAEAEEAAMVTSPAALKHQHLLEEQEQKL